MIKAICLRAIKFKGKQYEKFDLIDMSPKIFNAYKEFKNVDYAIKYKNNKEKKIGELSYRMLQRQCTEKGIYAVGTKEELLERLKAYQEEQGA